MTDEAFTTMPPPEVLVPKPTPPPFTVQPRVIDPATGQPKRGRGRPPGSRNKRTIVEGGVNPPQRLNVPTPKASEPVDQTLAKKEEKKARAEQYSTYIANELNDKLFMLIIGATNIPAEALYKEGKVPPKAKGNPALTDMGNAIAIPADVADSWGKLIAELTYTDAGKNLVKASENHAVTLLVAALTAAFSTFRYGQQLKPYLDMAKKVQQQARENNNNGEPTAG